ncbi:MAG: N-acetyl sugar amidotransferase [Bacteroidota bacterium]
MKINQTYQICNRCVMDTSDPEITFDSSGNCSHCNDFLLRRIHHKYQGEATDESFQQLITAIKRDGKGKKYDCIIGISGGIDSSYVALVAKQNGLRILGVHVDNGWNSDLAVQNIRNIVQKLDIEYQTFVLDWKEFKDLQLAFLKASVPEAETPTDIAMLGALHQIAEQHGVKYIISGGNFATEGILPAAWHYNAKDMRYLNYIQKTFGKLKLRKFPKFGVLQETYYKLVKRTKMVYLLNYIDYAKEQAMITLEQELAWKYYGGKHYESKYTGFIQSYYLFEKFGIDYRRATLSSQILTKEISREAAIEQVKPLPYKLEVVAEEKKYIAKKLGVSIDEFEEILKRPAKWYWDYPNSKGQLNFIYNTYRRIFKKEKLASF